MSLFLLWTLVKNTPALQVTTFSLAAACSQGSRTRCCCFLLTLIWNAPKCFLRFPAALQGIQALTEDSSFQTLWMSQPQLYEGTRKITIRILHFHATKMFYLTARMHGMPASSGLGNCEGKEASRSIKQSEANV